MLPTLTAGIEYNPIANDIGPIANWLALPEEGGFPALIVGTSSDRIGTSHGRSSYATISKDLEEWTGLPIAPYVGAAYGTFDDELTEIAGLAIRFGERVSTTSLWDGHNLHHIVETYIGDRHTLGLVIANLDGRYDVGLSYSIGF